MIELHNYVVTMKCFHWGRDIGCLPSPPYCVCQPNEFER